MLGLSRTAAENGARLVLWSEAAAEVLVENESDLLDQARSVAEAQGIYLVMGVVVFPEDREQVLENKLVAITPDGDVAWEYHKAKPVPGEPIAAGDQQLPLLDTPFGRITAAICFDADFPGLITQTSDLNAELLLIAADDWPAIATEHANMALVRGVENGISTLRATSNGRSFGATADGRIQDQMLHGENAHLLQTELPLQRQATLYPSAPAAIPAGSGLLMLYLFVAALVRRKQGQRKTPC